MIHMVDEVEGSVGVMTFCNQNIFHCTAPSEVNSITCS